MYANYEQAIEQMRAVGLDVDDLDIGRMVRCRAEGDRGRSKTGWYIVHELVVTSGDTLLVGAFGDWRSGVKHKIDLKGIAISPEERAAIRQRVADDRKRADAKRQAEAAKAARRAELAWRRCEPVGSSDYLIRKGVQGYGVRYSPQGNLVIAMHDANNQVHGLQVIFGGEAAKKKRGRDKDFWPPGLAKQGHFFLIGRPRPREVLLIAEGYATAASLHEATGWPAAVAFDAGNLVPVAMALRKRYREARILVCADDDFATKGNPGIAGASAAALAVNGAWLAPTFSGDDQVRLRAGIADGVDFNATDWRDQAARVLDGAGAGAAKLTDFNDLHLAEGLLVVRDQLEKRVEELGWTLGPGRSSDAERANGDGGDDDAGWHFDHDDLLRDYALIYSTDTVFDRRRRMIIGLGPLRSAAGKSKVRMWLEHPDRSLVMPEQVGFDPTEKDPDIACNLWAGWPSTPKAGSCDLVLEMLEYLCSLDQDPQTVYRWVLKWLAYPLQHPGAKMQTAVLMHGPEGTGKNTFFGLVREIYGRYGGIFDQSQLESQFNGWASGKLFMIGNEVVTRAEYYHIQGRLKNMVTEREWMINEKNLPVRSEANHCNFVFFSNRVDIARLDKDDRRYCVIWTPRALGREYYLDIAEEIRAGAGPALHDYLLNLELGDFNEHTKPPITRAKQDLIDIGTDSVERFWDEWTHENLPIPLLPCTTQLLYDGYRFWCGRVGIPKPAPQHILIGTMAKKPGVTKARKRYMPDTGQREQQAMCIFPPGASQPPEKSERTWLGESVTAHGYALEDWRKGPQ